MVSAEAFVIKGTISDWSVSLVECEEWSVLGVSRQMCDMVVDRKNLFIHNIIFIIMLE